MAKVMQNMHTPYLPAPMWPLMKDIFLPQCPIPAKNLVQISLQIQWRHPLSFPLHLEIDSHALLHPTLAPRTLARSTAQASQVQSGKQGP